MDQDSHLAPLTPTVGEQAGWTWESVKESPGEFRLGATVCIIGLALLTAGAGLWGWVPFVLGGLVATTSLVQQQKIGFLRTVAMDQVVDQWSTLISGAQERGEAVLDEVALRIRESEAPNVRMERRDVAPGWVRGVLGGRRSFLIVSDGDHLQLKQFRMYVNARRYGQNLQVNWYLLQQPGFGETMFRLSLAVPVLNFVTIPLFWIVRSWKANRSGMLDLDFFDQQDLSAYVANAHRCLLAAVDQLMVELDQDPARLDRKSRGFFGVS